MLERHHNELIRGLTAPELELVLPLLQKREYAAGQSILRSGEAGDCLYVIESGLVCVGLPSRGGEGVVLAQLGPGQIFGEMAVLTGLPRSADVRAVLNTVVSVLSLPSFFEVAGHSPTLLLNLSRVLATRLNRTTRASSQRERRALVVLVGPVRPLIGSLIATNLTAALAYVSARRSVLLDIPSPRAAQLPGREWSPGIDAMNAGADTLLHLSELKAGSVPLHVINLPDPETSSEPGDLQRLTAAVSGLTRAAELIVVNLTGPPNALVDNLVPLANRVYLVAPTSDRDDQLAALARRYEGLLGEDAALGAIALSGDGSPPKAVLERVRRALGLHTCEVLPGQADLLREAARVESPMTLRAPQLAVSKLVTRLAREVAGLRVGLALGSGAAKGVAHVGVIAALDRLGVPFDAVTGTSIGALVGAGLAMGMDRRQMEESMGRLVDLWSQALKPVIPRASLASPRGLARIVRDLAGDLRFDELQVPFGAVATDLNSGRAVYMCQGSVAQAVLASISIPLIFPPSIVGDYALVDGFVTNPIPTLLNRQLGADVVLASNLSRPVEESDQTPIEFVEPEAGSAARKQSTPNILETYLRCAEIMMSGRGEHDSLSADLTFRPRLPQISWRRFQKGGVPMQAGERAVEEEIESLRELLPWLRVAL